MATWQELVTRQPSFKGIPFQVKAVDTQFGRKLQDASAGGNFSIGAILGNNDKEKKQDKRPSFNEIGVLPKKVTVTLEFVGDTYNTTRDAFIAEVERGGAGKLVLPTYEIYTNALAEKGTVQFSDKRGGIESCTITFIIQGDLTSPTQANDTRGSVKNAAANSKTSGTSEFNLNSIVSGVESVFDAVVEDVDNFVDSVLDWLRSGNAKTTNDAGGVDNTFDDAIAELNDISDKAETLAADPVAQANAYNEVLEGIGSAFTTAESGFIALLGIASTYAGKIQTVTGAGPLAIARIQNRIAGLIFIQNACLSNAALLLSQLDFASVEDVQRIRETFVAAVRDLQDTIGGASGFAETYRDLVQLNAAVFDDLVARTAALPVLESRSIISTVPAMSYAFKKYGDADRIVEILTRNDIKRSLFASGDLELLSR